MEKLMSQELPIVLVPGLFGSPRLYLEQLPQLWRIGPVTIADNTRDDTIAGLARRILASDPPRFALISLSMGGYIAFEIMRQAADRVVKLALLDTSARPDSPEQSQRRREQISLAHSGRFAEIPDSQMPFLVHPSRQDDQQLRQIVRPVGGSAAVTFRSPGSAARATSVGLGHTCLGRGRGKPRAVSCGYDARPERMRLARASSPGRTG